MRPHMPPPARRKTFVVTDVAVVADKDADGRAVKHKYTDARTRMHFLRTADPALITDRRRLRQCVWQLQGCVKMLEEQVVLQRTVVF
jgi:hypothetical protein